MSTFNLNEFIAAVGQGLSKPNRFEVIITSPPCVAGTDNRLVSIMAENAQLPPTRINVARQQIFGPPSFIAQNADYGGENISITFNLDRQMTVKKFFDSWVDGIANRRSGTVAYQSTYVAQNMQIHQLDEQDNVMYTATFTDLFPIAVNPVQLDANMMNQASKLNVTFAYRRWFADGIATVKQVSKVKVPAKTPSTPKIDTQYWGGTNGKQNISIVGSLNGIQDFGGGAGG